MQDSRDSLPDKITPPGSFLQDPLTPPPTDTKPAERVLKVLNIIRQRRDGTGAFDSPWDKYKLRPEEYRQLIRLVRKDKSLWGYFEDKFRYDYDSSIETLVQRMPTRTHEVFLFKVVKEIERRLLLFTNIEGRTKAFAQKIEFIGSSTLHLRSGKKVGQAIMKRDPDGLFHHDDALWPGIVIEVSYSQKRKDLPRLADSYILETNGSVKLVVGLDVDYKTKQGTISTWHRNFVENEHGQVKLKATQTLSNQVFLDDSGGPGLSPDAGLRIELKDFAPDNLAEGISDFFVISASTLCRFLTEARQKEQNYTQKRGAVEDWPSGATKCYREETPPEEVSSDDDSEARDSDSDSSYKPSQ